MYMRSSSLVYRLCVSIQVITRKGFNRTCQDPGPHPSLVFLSRGWYHVTLEVNSSTIYKVHDIFSRHVELGE